MHDEPAARRAAQAAIRQHISEHHQFAITTHISPEGDATGSQLAMWHMLRALHRDALALSRDPVPSSLRFLPGADRILTPQQCRGAEVEVWLVLDCGDLARVGEEIKDWIQRSAAVIINIDHHVDNPRFGHVNYVRPAASTTQVLAELAAYLQVPIDKDLATCLYTGIVADTDSFRNANVTPQVLQTAAHLVASGADPRRVAVSLYERRSVVEQRLMGYVLHRLQQDGPLVWGSIGRDVFAQLGATLDDTERLVEELRATEGAEVAVLFKELDHGKVKVSIRSKGQYPVNVVAKAFGGGGHEKAAGCIVSGGLADVTARVLSEVKRRLAVPASS